jgi:hypothetical protein
MKYTKGYHLDCYKDLDIPKEWDNKSWGNDLVASFLYKQYMIWIDYPKDHKDYEDKSSFFQKKFLVEIWYGDDMNKATKMGFEFPMENAFTTDSFDELLEWMNSPIKKTNVKLDGCGYSDSEVEQIVKDYKINSKNKVSKNECLNAIKYFHEMGMIEQCTSDEKYYITILMKRVAMDLNIELEFNED